MKYKIIVFLLVLTTGICQNKKIDSILVVFDFPYTDYFVNNTCVYNQGSQYENEDIEFSTFMIIDSMKLKVISNMFLKTQLRIFKKNCDTRLRLKLYIKDRDPKCVCMSSNGCVEYGDTILYDENG